MCNTLNLQWGCKLSALSKTTKKYHHYVKLLCSCSTKGKRKNYGLGGGKWPQTFFSFIFILLSDQTCKSMLVL